MGQFGILNYVLALKNDPLFNFSGHEFSTHEFKGIASKISMFKCSIKIDNVTIKIWNPSDITSKASVCCVAGISIDVSILTG